MSFLNKEVLAIVFFFVIAYYSILRKIQWQAVFVASFVIYALLEKTFIVFTFISSLSAYLCTRKMEQIRSVGGERKKEKRYLILGLFINFGILFAFKYYFLVPKLFAFTGISFASVALPLGISFYTFKITSYIIDVYRKKYPAEQNYFKLYSWMIYFPAMLQGPIDKFDFHRENFFRAKHFEIEMISRGLYLILFALLKKFVIADRIAVGVQNVVANYPSYSGAVLFFSLFIFGIQIYADFSGGIDLVRGFSYLLGIELGKNFNSPYLATSVADYWRRWHITLGAWMREYVFYPMSLSKTFATLSKKSRQKLGAKYGKIVALLASTIIVYFLIGLWHGSGITSVLFGLFHGTVISLSLLLEDFRRKANEKMKLPNGVAFLLKVTWVNIIITIGRFFSKASTAGELWAMMKHTALNFADNNFIENFVTAMDISKINYIVITLGVLILILIAYFREKYKDVYQKLTTLPAPVLLAGLTLTFLLVMVFGFLGEEIKGIEFVYMKY